MNGMMYAKVTVHLSFWDTSADDVIALRLYSDQDRDLVFDLVDAMPIVGNQWMNTDSDNYGDNPLGPLGDDCPNTPGVSGWLLQGCSDFDTDGFADQFGGEKGKKFKYKPFKRFLIDLYSKPMADQKELIADSFKSWRGDFEQVDDVCIIGISL